MPADMDEDKTAIPGDKKGIRCARCGVVITSGNFAVPINGKHQHTCFNPVGIVFEILCFSGAPGVKTTGEKSVEFSWFAGYGWQVVQCRGCGLHMGWKFSGQEPLFYGLIRQNLTGSQPGGGG